MSHVLIICGDLKRFGRYSQEGVGTYGGRVYSCVITSLLKQELGNGLNWQHIFSYTGLVHCPESSFLSSHDLDIYGQWKMKKNALSTCRRTAN